MLKIKENKTHPKIKDAIIQMNSDFIAEGVSEFEFYMYFLNHVSFYEADMPMMPTMCATVINNRLAICWTEEFVDSLTVRETMTLLIHEAMHLLSNHLNRGKGYDQEVANIAMDMIINHLIVKYHGKYVNFPVLTKDAAEKVIAENPDLTNEQILKVRQHIGKVCTVELDTNYKGDLVFEPLYNWLQEQNQKEKKGEPNEMSASTKQWMKMAEKMKGMTLDYHGDMSEVEDDIRKSLAKNARDKAKYDVQKSRGTVHGGIDEILDCLLKEPKKNNLKVLRQMIGSLKGKIKVPSFRRLNRRVPGLKGHIKHSLEVNVILDTSGSMAGEFELALTEIFLGGYTVNMIQCDTRVTRVEKITDRKQLNKLKISGLGGTVIMPAVQYVMDKKNRLSKFPTAILSDGYTDTLDFGGSMAQFLLITTQQLIPYVNGPNVRSIRVEK